MADCRPPAFWADEGSVKASGGTHLLKEQVTIVLIRLGGALFLEEPKVAKAF